MPRYFFHIDHRHPHVDELGEQLPDDAAAWAEALRLTRDIEDRLRPGDRWSVEVRRHSKPIYRVSVTTELLE
jgi:hypothetical protein